MYVTLFTCIKNYVKYILLFQCIRNRKITILPFPLSQDIDTYGKIGRKDNSSHISQHQHQQGKIHLQQTSMTHQHPDMNHQQQPNIAHQQSVGRHQQSSMPHQQSQQHRRSRSRTRSRSRVLTPGIGDSEDYETLGSETETEHGGLSSMTESSNQLDGQSTLRDHSLAYSRGPAEELKCGNEGVYGPKPKTMQRDRTTKEKVRKDEANFQQRIHHSKYKQMHMPIV